MALFWAKVMKFGVVVIGRNEGDRLVQCLASLSKARVDVLVYVDSGSTDGSPQRARLLGAQLVQLDMRVPFTAARARNAGFRHLLTVAPDIAYVQFVDGDCELNVGWLEVAVTFLNENPGIAAVFGRLSERHPRRSIYNWLCEREWQGPSGAVRACGGIAMMRVAAFEAVSGFREDVIASEDRELCVRLRAAGWGVWRLDAEMATHDAAMIYFRQWWRRALRGGYGYAHGAYLHGTSPERHWVWEARRAWLWGVWFPLACMVSGLLYSPWGWTAWLIYPVQVLRQTFRNEGSLADRALLAVFQVLARFPEGYGQLKFMCDRLLGRRPLLIEYKS
jgi:GT2 family glycosyltransferase